jgi:chromatin remodeling complex protein RSC6
MSRKQQSSTQPENKKTQAVPETKEAVSRKRQPRTAVSEIAETPAPVVSSSSSAVSASGVETTSKRTRVPVSVDSLKLKFDAVTAFVNEEMARVKSDDKKPTKVNFFKSLSKQLKGLMTDSVKGLTQKRPSTRTNNSSGFKKQVPVSTELAEFAGWESGSLHSRVEVTKNLCEYINTHNLQNPEARKEIRAGTDPKLRRLFGIDETTVITYPSMQTYLKRHFPATKASAVPVVSAQAPVVPVVVPAPSVPSQSVSRKKAVKA